MTRHGISFWLRAGSLAWGLMGCSVGGVDAVDRAPKGNTPTPAGGELQGARVPANFTFATTRSVTLQVDADRSLFRAERVAGIEVTNAAHALIFRGPIRIGQSLVLPLSVPTKDGSLNVTFRAPGVEQTRSVAIVNNQAIQIFM